MHVKAPMITPKRPGSARPFSRGASTLGTPGSRNTEKDDNYEYNMLKKVREGDVPGSAGAGAGASGPGQQAGESLEDYDARMERLYQKKQRAKERRKALAAEKAKTGAGDGSDDEGSGSGSDASAETRRLARKKQNDAADYESESDYESDSDDDSEDDSQGDEDGLYAKRKKMRKKKRDREKRRKRMTRLQKAIKEVRGGVRSYGDTARTLTNKLQEVPKKELKKLQASKQVAALTEKLGIKGKRSGPWGGTAVTRMMARRVKKRMMIPTRKGALLADAIHSIVVTPINDVQLHTMLA